MMNQQVVLMAAVLSLLIGTSTCMPAAAGSGRSMLQQDSSAPPAGGGGGLGGFGLLGGNGGGQGSSSGGLGLGLLDGMDASSLGWDGSTFSQGIEQLNQWLSDVQTTAMDSLRDRPLAGALLSESGAAQDGGFLSSLGLGGSSDGSGGILQQMAQSGQGSTSSGGSNSGNSLFGGSGGLFSGFGQGQQQGGQFLDGSVLERLRSAFGGGGDGGGEDSERFLQQLMSGLGGGERGSFNFADMLQNAGRMSGGSANGSEAKKQENSDEKPSLSERYMANAARSGAK